MKTKNRITNSIRITNNNMHAINNKNRVKNRIINKHKNQDKLQEQRQNQE